MRFLLVLLLVAGCGGGGNGGNGGNAVTDGSVYYYHDAEHRVSCWTVYANGISCLPDSEVTFR